MFLKNKTDWKLLAKYLAGEVNDGESKAITEWLDRKPENRTLFNQLKSDWKIMDKMNLRFNVDNAWDKLYNRIRTGEMHVVREFDGNRKRHAFRLLFTPIKVAATILLAVALGTAIIYLNGNLMHTTIATDANNAASRFELPDGSTIYLNADTRLSYSRNFGRKNRDVRLVGEAYFEVTPDQQMPFVISAHKARVKVVGTSFNVNAKIGANKVEVYVTSGKVELSEANNGDNFVLLEPGYIGKLDMDHISATKSDNSNCIAWKTGKLDFRDTRLSEVVEVLSDVYRVNILFRESGLDTTRINGNYDKDPLDSILKVICTQNHLIVEKVDNKVYLSR
jgi:ferric-dicitrate binding protein FerR (iron transport regulator)